MHSISCRKKNTNFVYSQRQQFLKPKKGPFKKMGLIWILHPLRYARQTGKQNREKSISVILYKLNYSEINLTSPNINHTKHDHQAGISHIPLGASALKYLASDQCFSKHLWHKILWQTLLSFGCAEVWNKNQKKNLSSKNSTDEQRARQWRNSDVIRTCPHVFHRFSDQIVLGLRT
jgi:hypothetical protein